MQRLDGGTFVARRLDARAGRTLQGDGLTLCIDDGALLERGGCNFSHVRGPQLPPSATQHRPELAGAPFEALGVSLVFHPRNPYVPTVHMNVRMFAALPGRQATRCSGSAAAWTSRRTTASRTTRAHFHRTCRDALAPFGARPAPALQALVRRVLLPQAPQRAARRRRHLLRRLLRARLRARLRRCCARWAMRSSAPTCRSSSAGATRRTASASATSRPSAAAATWSSTWCGTAARCSACSRAGAPRAS